MIECTVVNKQGPSKDALDAADESRRLPPATYPHFGPISKVECTLCSLRDLPWLPSAGPEITPPRERPPSVNKTDPGIIRKLADTGSIPAFFNRFQWTFSSAEGAVKPPPNFPIVDQIIRPPASSTKPIKSSSFAADFASGYRPSLETCTTPPRVCPLCRRSLPKHVRIFADVRLRFVGTDFDPQTAKPTRTVALQRKCL